MRAKVRDTGWQVFGEQREFYIGNRKVTIWVEGVYTKANPYEWHLSATDYDDCGNAMSLDEGKTAAGEAVTRFRKWARQQRRSKK